MSGPAIPVRHTKRMNTRRLNQMNGDYLLQLKTNSVRSEFGQHVCGQNTAASCEMKKKVGMWYKEQRHVLAKLNKSQAFVYKTLLRVHKEKNKIAQQADGRQPSDEKSLDYKGRLRAARKHRKIGESVKPSVKTEVKPDSDNDIVQDKRSPSKQHDVNSINSEMVSHQSTISTKDVMQVNTMVTTSISGNVFDRQMNETLSHPKSMNIQIIDADTLKSTHVDVVGNIERHDTDELINQVKLQNTHPDELVNAASSSLLHRPIIQKTKVLEVRKSNLKDPSTKVRKEQLVMDENMLRKDDSVLERYLREQMMYTEGKCIENEAHPLTIDPQICENKSPELDANNNDSFDVHGPSPSPLKGDLGKNDGVIIETGKRRLSVHFSPLKEHEKIVLPIRNETPDSSSENKSDTKENADPNKEEIVQQLHEDYLEMRNGSRKGSLPPLKSSAGSVKYRIPPPTGYLRHSAPEHIDLASNANKYFEFPRPTIRETLETWYDKKAVKKSKTGRKQRRPTLVELNDIYKQLKEMKKREILNEPFQIYRKNSRGDIIPDELPHRRAKFSIPSCKTKNKHKKLLDEEMQKGRAYRRKLESFYQMLSDKGTQISTNRNMCA